MGLEHRQVNQASLLQNTWLMEAPQHFRSTGLQLHPIRIAALGINAQNADPVLLAELLYPQNSISGLAIKLGSGCFAQHRLCSAGPYLFSYSFHEGEAGG